MQRITEKEHFQARGGSMATIQPKGEKVRQAVKWISDKRQEEPEKAIIELIQAASGRFNLSPKEEEFLMSFYKHGAGELD
jgi:hypothetical protein